MFGTIQIAEQNNLQWYENLYCQLQLSRLFVMDCIHLVMEGRAQAKYLTSTQWMINMTTCKPTPLFSLRISGRQIPTSVHV